MADPPPNSGVPADVPATKAKKKKAAKGPKKPPSELSPEELAKLDAESAKRRNRRLEQKREDAAAAYAVERAALEAARQKAEAEEKEAIISKAHALLMLGLCRPTSFAAAPVGPASTGSSVARPPQCPSPTSSTTPLSPGFPPPRCQGQTRFSGSPEVSVIAPSTPRPSAVIDLNVTPGSSSGGRPSVEMQRKQARPPSTAAMPSPRVLFGEMPTPTPAVDDPFYAEFMENVIFEGRGEAFQRVSRARPSIRRRPRVKMAAASTWPTKTLRPTMETRGMKKMTYIVKVKMKNKKRKAWILRASHCSSTSSPKERKHKKRRRAFVRDHTRKRKTS